MRSGSNLSDAFSDKKILVTGHTGFKGAWLCEWLLMLGCKVYGISLPPSSSPSLYEKLNLENRISGSFLFDIRNKSKLETIIHEIKPDFIFHLAAQAIVLDSYQNPIETFETNILGTCNLLESLRTLKTPCSTVIVTSDKCYENKGTGRFFEEGDPLGGNDPYSASKACAEIVTHSYFQSFFTRDSNQRIATARAGNVIGGGDWSKHRIVSDCIRAWSESKSVELRNSESTRPWQHVLDCLNGYLTLASYLHEKDKSLNGESFNFSPSSDSAHSVLDLVKTMQKNWSGARFESIKNLTSKPEAKQLGLNSSKAKKNLGWNTVLDFNSTATWTVDWYKSFYEQKDILLTTQSQIKDFIKKAGSQ